MMNTVLTIIQLCFWLFLLNSCSPYSTKAAATEGTHDHHIEILLKEPRPNTNELSVLNHLLEEVRDIKQILKTGAKNSKKASGHTGAKKDGKPCGSTGCKVSDNAKLKDEQASCILSSVTKTAVSSKHLTVQLPVPIKAGLKLTVSGGYDRSQSKSMLIFRKLPDNPTDVFCSYYVRLEWIPKRLVFVNGPRLSSYKRDFPISNPSNFTIEVELTPSSTKIYADKVLVKSLMPIPEIKIITLHGYSNAKVSLQKKGEGCNQDVTGM